MNRSILWFACVVLVALAAQVSAAASPNVLVILTDDQGWGDLSFHGNTNLQTPHLDSIAKEGATFENFYVCAVCAPTRAEFLTGRYHPRTGVSGVSRGEERINADETTIADVFRKAGYATGAFGKWHNGTQAPLHPNFRGFQEYYGFTSGHWGHYFSPPLDHNGNEVRGDGFVVDDFTNRAIEFIKSRQADPFLCYLALNTPHSPMMVEDRFYKKFEGVDPKMRYRDPQREDIMMTRAALAMVENIDWNVGRLLKTLSDLQIADDTIVVFFCDNGPNSYRFNGGMKGRKGSIDEGGLRSPLFIRWPSKLKPGTKISQVAGAIDLLPTLAECCGFSLTTPQPIDGKSLLPLLIDDRANLEERPFWDERFLFSYRNKRCSVRSQRFRLDGFGRLFDIEKDRGQLTDVSKQHPAIVKRLVSEQQRHVAEMTALSERYADRPFLVGYDKKTTLPARDAVSHGCVTRSAKPPNNSFFTGWTDEDGSITWDVQMHVAGNYEAVLKYTCAEGDQGVTIQLSSGDAGKEGSTSAVVTDVYDPPLYDKSKERVEKSHYFVKDFKPLSLGSVRLEKGRAVLKLTAKDIQGKKAIDVHSIQLIRE